jgi:Fur family transcriptional regulator, ferric uptake regulator
VASREQAKAAGVLEGAGVRATRQRVVVLSELMGEQNDVTAQELHERLRGRGERLGLATVYRTLGLLAQGGVIDSLSHRPGELCYRWCGEGHHHHLVCSSCHQVVELDDCELEPWLARVSQAHDFVTTGHRLEVSGLCGDCR